MKRVVAIGNGKEVTFNIQELITPTWSCSQCKKDLGKFGHLKIHPKKGVVCKRCFNID